MLRHARYHMFRYEACCQKGLNLVAPTKSQFSHCWLLFLDFTAMAIKSALKMLVFTGFMTSAMTDVPSVPGEARTSQQETVGRATASSSQSLSIQYQLQRP